ncbi:TIGR04388 family protein [Leptospira inadai]|uniref:TIGR04388 family protein n=1 Tax=Leptospira inadai TaxID=29506 RepID=UPI0009F69735|nr:TIGR04388 family protein [Leptospira inadai]
MKSRLRGAAKKNGINAAENVSLLSAANTALLNSRMSYVDGMVGNLSSQLTFTDSGLGQLLKANGDTIYTGKAGKDGNQYIADIDGNMKRDANGNGITLQSFINSTCGQGLANAACSSYTTKEYTSVVANADGSITLTKNMHTGTSSLTGGDAGDSSNYKYDTTQRQFTIAAPGVVALDSQNTTVRVDDPNGSTRKGGILGPSVGQSGTGINIFDSSSVGNLVSSAFTNLQDYMSGANLQKMAQEMTGGLGYIDKQDSMLLSAAQTDAQNKAQTASLIEDYAKNVLLGGVSTGDWVKGQVKSATQSLIATALSNTFDLSPEAASFLAGAWQDKIAAKNAQHSINNSFTNVGNILASGGMSLVAGADLKIMSNIPGLSGISKAIMDVSYPGQEADIQKYKNDKFQAYGLAVTEFGKMNGWDPTVIQQFSQYAVDAMRNKSAKQELGMTGPALSLGRIGNELNTMAASLEGPLAEGMGALTHAISTGLAGLHVISGSKAEDFNDATRIAINDIKLKGNKDAVTQYKADQVSSAGFVVQQYGKANGWSQAQIDQYAKMAEQFVQRQQGKQELNRDKLLLDAANLATGGLLEADQQLLHGGLESTVAKFAGGVMKTLGDLGHDLGVISASDNKSIYKQSSDFQHTIDLSKAKGEANTGNVSLSQQIKQATRDKVFDAIGEMLSPNFGGADPHAIGQLLEQYENQQTARKNAANQRLEDAAQGVAIVTAAIITGLSGGAGAPLLEAATALSTGAAVTADGAMMLTAVGANIATQTYVGSRVGGTNGAVAGFANGVISAATMATETPVSGYVSYTPHQNANIITGQQEVAGGWGGGIVAAGTVDQGAMKGLGVNGGLSFTPGSGLNINVNANLPNANGTYVGISYNTSNGGYTVNGGYNIAKYGNNNFGLNVSASDTGVVNAGVNYSYSGGGDNRWTNTLSNFGGAFLNFSNTGEISLSNQFKGVNTVSVGYNTDTHSFGPLGINGSFSTDLLTSLVQEHAAASYENDQLLASAKVDQAKSYGDILVQMGEFTPEEIANLHTDPNGNEKIVAAFNEIRQNAIDSGNEGAFGQRLQDAINNLNQQNNTDIPVNDPLNDRSSWPQNADEQAGKNILDLGYALTKKDDQVPTLDQTQSTEILPNTDPNASVGDKIYSDVFSSGEGVLAADGNYYDANSQQAMQALLSNAGIQGNLRQVSATDDQNNFKDSGKIGNPIEVVGRANTQDRWSLVDSNGRTVLHPKSGVQSDGSILVNTSKSGVQSDGSIQVTGSRYEYSISDNKGNTFKYGYGPEGESGGIQYLSINGKPVQDGSTVSLGKDGKLAVVKDLAPNSTVFTNGIKNNPIDAIQSIYAIQERTGQSINLVYNLSEGFNKDLSNSALGKLGKNAETSQSVLTKYILEGKIDTLLAHSQGSLISGNALMDASKANPRSIENINWVTFGSPAGINSIPDKLNSAVFYQNINDPVAASGIVGRAISAYRNDYSIRLGGGWGHNFVNGYGNAVSDYFNANPPSEVKQ